MCKIQSKTNKNLNNLSKDKQKINLNNQIEYLVLTFNRIEVGLKK